MQKKRVDNPEECTSILYSQTYVPQFYIHSVFPLNPRHMYLIFNFYPTLKKRKTPCKYGRKNDDVMASVLRSRGLKTV